MSKLTYQSPLQPLLPKAPGERLRWGRLYGSSVGLVVARAAARYAGPLMVITEDTATAYRLEQELRFFAADAVPILPFPDWETLPYDMFSPHQDIVSERLKSLYQLPQMERGILIVPVGTLMHRIAPRAYVQANSLLLDVGERLDVESTRLRLEAAGYHRVSQVMEHGEYAVRGSLIDLFPMGSTSPYRIDLLDEEVESIRTFDPETQRTSGRVKRIHLLPAREFPLDSESIQRFRHEFRIRFEGNPNNAVIYREVSNAAAPPGIEYYLPLFFERMETLFDYLPPKTLVVGVGDITATAAEFRAEAAMRFEQLRHDIERPLLPPERLFLDHGDVGNALAQVPCVELQRFEIDSGCNYATAATPKLNVKLSARTTPPSETLKNFVAATAGRILLVAETGGRREMLLELLREADLKAKVYDSWPAFHDDDARLGICVAPLERGLCLEQPEIIVLAEEQLFGEQVMQRRRRRPTRDAESIIRNLTELDLGAPVVHEEHGIGRYRGLQKLRVGAIETEFLTLEYAGGDKLYVPVSSLHLISRYTGAAPEKAPLHRLGSEQWAKVRRKAAERVRDVAAELLDIYARRAARKGRALPPPDDQYAAFAGAFPFEETPDQEQAIDDVLGDLRSDKPMDRLVCGDVGFGKTEVAMRAAFMVAEHGRQVAVLVPTTLLAQQHYQNFKDRFADWPVRVEVLSRFRAKREQADVTAGLERGAVDIVIGTHKLLQENIKFKNLGLVILDEEHRFGVRQKERLKSLRSEVDVLTLTATPIPRTLNMAISDLRDLSIIATPPSSRLAIKTFVREWDDALLNEACVREIRRGGQVYFLHNEVESIDKMADQLRKLVPHATVRVAHGQMRERELEQVMLDFYHQRFNILVCTTIIETGIDVPSANTIIMNRADKFGLAQLYQLRGRVGRSHHRAYAYLVVPPRRAMTPDAIKRLEAIESLEELGTGFMLATHDLEIRGAGELLGEEQSGQMQEIGYTMYTELLERAVAALKAGRQPDLERPLNHGAEIDLNVPALIPDDYMPDVHNRLIMYKRIASAATEHELRELQVEMIDRFGLLPEAVKTLFRITELKLKALPLGIQKIEAGPGGGRLVFGPEPNINAAELVQLIQSKPHVYKLDGQEKLRYVLELPTPDDRLRHVDRLLADLTMQDAA